jgi:ring-1,2-phenylacetyl-CoA epoxidase subunit PaaD
VTPAERVDRIDRIDRIAEIAGGVEDPELPSVTIGELGILRGVQIDEHDHVDVNLTPTYSGCPAVEVIEHDVRAALAEAGWSDVTVWRVLSPAWTTDWITPEGRRKLAAGGIAPPSSAAAGAGAGAGNTATFSQPVAFVVRCPQCGSGDTEELAHFGSTACKALRRCRSCAEPFDHFKPL